ncbi:MAG: nucleoside triphosphate pyrophosphohydrolase family protein [Saprospiraceae bacterium]|nr:nucleoside triphosphate pyrophosphohydrolase family protein [Saprospiraceae bacterium]
MTKGFEEPQALRDVGEFHHTFDLPILETPTIPDEKRCALRINLLQEELNELKAAIADQDLVEVADALCDLQYVLSGAVHEFGLGARFRELFEEVQRSNMSKVCHDREEAEATAQHYLDKSNTDSEIVAKGDLFLVYRKEDRKVLKSVKYSPAALEPIVTRD